METDPQFPRRIERAKELPRRFSLFSLFFPKFTASELSSAAEILDFRAIEAANNSEPLAVLSLFPAVFVGS